MNADGTRTMIRKPPDRTIGRRLAIYISGFDPRGHRFLYSVFRDELQKHVARKGISGTTSAVEASPPDKPWLKRWHASLDEGSGPVETIVDFLEWQDLIPRRKKWRFLSTVGAGLATFRTMIAKGVFRRLRLYGRSHVALAFYPFMMMIVNLVIMAALVVAGFATGARYGFGYGLLGAVAGALLAAGWYWVTRRLERRTFAWFSLDFWSFQKMQGEAEVPAIVARVDLFADYILDRMADPGYDEVVVFALSTGGYFAVDLVGAMLERDPEFKRSGRRLPFVTFGVAPSAAGWFGPTDRFLRAVKAVLKSRAVDWVSFVIRKDMMAASGYNPVRDFELDPRLYNAGKIRERRIDLKRMLRPETLRALRGNFFRKHLHYMMASETGEEHDFFDIICTAKPVVEASGL